MTRPIIPASAKPKGLRLGVNYERPLRLGAQEQGKAALRGVADFIACAGLFLAIYAGFLIPWGLS